MAHIANVNPIASDRSPAAERTTAVSVLPRNAVASQGCEVAIWPTGYTLLLIDTTMHEIHPDAWVYRVSYCGMHSWFKEESGRVCVNSPRRGEGGILFLALAEVEVTHMHVRM